MMKRLIYRTFLLISVLFLLTAAVFAAEGDFNAGLTITKYETSISVEVQNSDVFESKTVKLTIPTGMDWDYAKVTFDGTKLDNVTWDAATKSVTFPVTAGGTYVISEAEAPTEEEPPAEDNPPSNPPSADRPSIHEKPGEDEAPAVPPMRFSDVAKSDWFYNDVKFVYENGLMNGMGNGKFAPNGSMTRGMMVQILYNMAGKPAIGSESFHDVSRNDWYHDAVAWASAKGIVDGMGNGSFLPQASITREQLAVMLQRYAKYCGLITETPTGYLNGFADAGSVSAWAVSAMNWAVREGLINGMDGKLNPKGSATRAQTAAVLTRYCS